jgi:hypothetical protein
MSRKSGEADNRRKKDGITGNVCTISGMQKHRKGRTEDRLSVVLEWG